MINGISITTNEAGYEQVSINGTLSGGGPYVNVLAIRADLDAGQQTTYDDFLGLLQDKAYSTITNTVPMCSFDRITSVVVTEDAIDLDYNTMSAGDKTKVDAFVTLIDVLTTE